MADQTPKLPKGVPYDGEEQQLWQSLQALPTAEPDAGLRRNFYDRLDQASQPGWAERLSSRFGMVALLAPAPPPTAPTLSTLPPLPPPVPPPPSPFPPCWPASVDAVDPSAAAAGGMY